MTAGMPDKPLPPLTLALQDFHVVRAFVAMTLPWDRSVVGLVWFIDWALRRMWCTIPDAMLHTRFAETASKEDGKSQCILGSMAGCGIPVSINSGRGIVNWILGDPSGLRDYSHPCLSPVQPADPTGHHWPDAEH